MRPWHKASELAEEVGRRLAQDEEKHREFVEEQLAERNPARVFECGKGLA